MQKIKAFDIFNSGQIRGMGAGHRTLFGLQKRTKIRLLEPGTLKEKEIDLHDWETMNPKELAYNAASALEVINRSVKSYKRESALVRVLKVQLRAEVDLEKYLA